MNRKNFLYVSGTALGSLLFHEFTFTGGNAAVLQLPSTVFIRLDDGQHQLISNGHGKWSYKNVQVQLKHVGEALNVSVSAPGTALHSLVLEWMYATPGTAALLGDHWERSYGDLHFQPAAFANKMPWYFVQYNENNTTCFGVKTGCATICHWQTVTRKCS